MSNPLRVVLGATVLLVLALPAAAQTPDSAFAVSASGQSLFRVNVDGGASFRGTYDGGGSGGIPVEGAGTRLMWYPRRAAIRVGGVSGTYWDDGNIGNYSVAMGEDVRAQGSHATAFGLRAWAFAGTSFAVGEDVSATGASSVAMGYHAHTNARSGSFVFADRSSVDTLRAGLNFSANWRVMNGFRIFTSSNLATGVTIQSGLLTSNWGQSDAVISTSTGAYLHTNGTWVNNSDVNRKHLFAPVAGEDLLLRLRGLSITTWTYRVENAGVRHMGPMAQDFRAAFGLGSDPKTISTVDADGVALAAAQALEARTRGLDARIHALERENAALRLRDAAHEREAAELRARLDAIERMLRAAQKP